MTPLELLRQLNELDEHPRIEAKEGTAMGRSILETVCAFANEPGLGGGWLKNATYRDLNRVDVLNASNHLRRLRDQGLLEQRGKGSATYYVPTDRFFSSLFADLSGIEADGTLSGNLQLLSGNLSTQSGNPSPLSGNLASPPGDLPADLTRRIQSLGQRVSQPDLAQLAVEICGHRPFSADELAATLGKNRKYLLDRVLTPLLRNGHLRHTIKGQPNHPDQAYTATQEPESSTAH